MTSAPPPPPPSIPAGWYPNGDVQRYWDGTAWTEHTAPLVEAPAPQSAPAPVTVSRQSGPPTVVGFGQIHATTNMKIYSDGTFSTGFAGGKHTGERLIGFEHDMDSMRRKSMTGRGGAALVTGGLSLAASNNRGVVYVTVIGERTGTKTYTTRNPSGTLLTGIRTLKAAADSLIR